MARWQPFNPVWQTMNQLQGEMNRLFQRVSGNGSSMHEWTAYPPINLWDDGENIYLTAELPGMAMSELEIFVSGDRQLTIKGERTFNAPEKAVRHRQERSFGKFHRVVELPFAVDADNVEAKLDRGVLRLKMAKHESARPRKIKVSGD